MTEDNWETHGGTDPPQPPTPSSPKEVPAPLGEFSVLPEWAEPRFGSSQHAIKVCTNVEPFEAEAVAEILRKLFGRKFFFGVTRDGPSEGGVDFKPKEQTCPEVTRSYRDQFRLIAFGIIVDLTDGEESSYRSGFEEPEDPVEELFEDEDEDAI